MRSAIWWVIPVLAIALLAGCSRVEKPQTENLGNQAKQQVKSPGEPSGKPGSKPAKPDTESQSGKKEEPAAPKLKVVGQKVSLNWQEGGKPKLSATAVELTGDTLAGKAVMKRVSAELYQDGKLVAKLVAPNVEADEKTRVVTASGGIILTSTVPESTIRTVKCNWIKWYSKSDKIVGNGGVTATGPLAKIKAAAFTADTKLRTVKVTADPSEAKAVVGKR
ncbi:MAG: LPS export ABC transporter periplasmic protein LptC [Armatimonadota bacterium]